MKSPLWIITSILAIILMVLFVFVLYSMRTLFVRPRTTSIKVPAVAEVEITQEVKPQDLSLIYEEHDLFSTYRPAIVPVKPVETLPVIPPPPPRIPLRPKVRPKTPFLKPLPLKITGIIASSTEAKSQVSLMNTNSLRTESFKTGDKVLDAYVLRIFPRKITIIRSNGQQETLYMYPEEAKNETTLMQDTSWPEVIQQQGELRYLLNPTAFASRIHSLATLVELLDLTTASKAGKPLGVRIGKMKPTSIGFAAGLRPGDIILKIFDIPATSTNERLNIFNEIVSLNLGAAIPVQIMRGDTIQTITYVLFNLADPTAMLEDVGIKKIAPRKKPVAAPAQPVAPVAPTEPTTPDVAAPQIPPAMDQEKPAVGAAAPAQEKVPVETGAQVPPTTEPEKPTDVAAPPVQEKTPAEGVAPPAQQAPATPEKTSVESAPQTDQKTTTEATAQPTETPATNQGEQPPVAQTTQTEQKPVAQTNQPQNSAPVQMSKRRELNAMKRYGGKAASRAPQPIGT